MNNIQAELANELSTFAGEWTESDKSLENFVKNENGGSENFGFTPSQKQVLSIIKRFSEGHKILSSPKSTDSARQQAVDDLKLSKQEDAVVLSFMREMQAKQKETVDPQKKQIYQEMSDLAVEVSAENLVRDAAEKRLSKTDQQTSSLKTTLLNTIDGKSKKKKEKPQIEEDVAVKGFAVGAVLKPLLLELLLKYGKDVAIFVAAKVVEMIIRKLDNRKEQEKTQTATHQALKKLEKGGRE